MYEYQQIGDDSAALDADGGVECFSASEQYDDDGVEVNNGEEFEFIVGDESFLLVQYLLKFLFFLNLFSGIFLGGGSRHVFHLPLLDYLLLRRALLPLALFELFAGIYHQVYYQDDEDYRYDQLGDYLVQDGLTNHRSTPTIAPDIIKGSVKITRSQSMHLLPDAVTFLAPDRKEARPPPIRKMQEMTMLYLAEQLSPVMRRTLMMLPPPMPAD